MAADEEDMPGPNPGQDGDQGNGEAERKTDESSGARARSGAAGHRSWSRDLSRSPHWEWLR